MPEENFSSRRVFAGLLDFFLTRSFSERVVSGQKTSKILSTAKIPFFGNRLT